MKINVHWKYANNKADDILKSRQVLYSYTDNRGEEIVYIGKAYACSVKERLSGRHKDKIFEYLRKTYKFKEYGLAVGKIKLPKSNRLSAKLVSDIESLLIYKLKPSANIQSIRSRISRPGMEIVCCGDWPYEDNRFVDE